MQFFIYGSPPGPMAPEAMAEMGKFMEDSVKKGIIVAAGGLKRTETRIRLEGGKLSLTDGPFMEAKELMPGFAVIQVDTKEEAVDWVTRLRKFLGNGESKVVQVFGPS